MKKYAVVALVLLLLISLCACGGDNSAVVTTPEQTLGSELAPETEKASEPEQLPDGMKTATATHTEAGTASVNYPDNGSIVFSDTRGGLLYDPGITLTADDFVIELGFTLLAWDTFEELAEETEEYEYNFEFVNYGGYEGFMHTEGRGEAYLTFPSLMADSGYLIEMYIYTEDTQDEQDDEAALALVQLAEVQAILETLSIDVYVQTEPTPTATPAATPTPTSTPEPESEPEGEAPEPEFIDAEYITFTACDGWYLDEVKEIAGKIYDLRRADDEWAYASFSAYEMSSPKEKIADAISGMERIDNIVINGVEYIVLENDSRMQHLITSRGEFDENATGAIIIKLQFVTIEEFMPVLETIVITGN